LVFQVIRVRQVLRSACASEKPNLVSSRDHRDANPLVGHQATPPPEAPEVRPWEVSDDIHVLIVHERNPSRSENVIEVFGLWHQPDPPEGSHRPTDIRLRRTHEEIDVDGGPRDAVNDAGEAADEEIDDLRPVERDEHVPNLRQGGPPGGIVLSPWRPPGGGLG